MCGHGCVGSCWAILGHIGPMLRNVVHVLPYVGAIWGNDTVIYGNAIFVFSKETLSFVFCICCFLIPVNQNFHYLCSLGSVTNIQAQPEFSLMEFLAVFLVLAFAAGILVGAALTAIIWTCTTCHPVPAEPLMRLVQPEMVWVTRTGGAYHLVPTCGPKDVQDGMKELKLCKHCAKSQAKKQKHQKSA